MPMQSQRIDDILAKPLSLWIISIIIAAGMWFYVIGTQDDGEIRRTVSCRVQYVNVAPQLEIKNRLDEVWVYVSGRESEVGDLDEMNITCEVDARGLTSGRYRLPINVRLPKGVRLRELHPTQADVDLIRYADRIVEVEVVLPKDLQEGFYLDSVELTPKQVTIKGIERDLAYIDKVRISPTAEELRSGKELFLPPEFESSEHFEEQVRIEPQLVRFKAFLVSGNPRRMVPVKARMSGTPDEDYVVFSTTVAPAELLVEGPKEVIDRLVSIETGTVDITGIKESASMVISIRPPMDRLIKVLGEGTVRVSVNLQPMSAAKEIANIPVKIEGAPQQSWKAFPSAVTVTIEGLPSKINSAAVESLDIEAFVNAENLFSKQAVLPVRTKINSDLFRVTKVNPFTVSVSSEPE
ncbi:MAG: CdaR family protein [Synergistaceae bacterium]|nr:CdaR family protein [Synergistaceae bacterium]